MEPITVIAIGEEVTLHDDIKATVVGVMLHQGPRIEYEVAWWSGKSRHCEWVDSFEIQVSDNANGCTIGFKAKE